MAKKTKSPINVDVAARAEAKLLVKARVPTASVGRLVDAFTDMVRPFSEARGLKADLIRLQREDVAIEITRRAKEKVLLEAAEISPVPTKLIVPLLEKGSCEDVDDDYMLERWADLLASAALKKKVEPRFIGILSELSGSQAQALEKIAFNGWTDVEYPGRCFADASIELAPESLRHNLQESVETELTSLSAAESCGEALEDFFARPGGHLILVDLFIDHDHYYQWIGEGRGVDGKYLPGEESDQAILESLGLIRQGFVEITHDLKGVSPRKQANIRMSYHYLTTLGADFCEVCCREKVRELFAVDESSRQAQA